MRQLLRINEAAKQLGVCTKTLRNWDKENILTSVRLPAGHRRYRPEDIERFAAKLRKSSKD